MAGGRGGRGEGTGIRLMFELIENKPDGASVMTSDSQIEIECSEQTGGS